MSLVTPYACIVIISLILIYLIRELLWLCCFSPLSRIPAAHPLCHVSNAWVIWKRYNATENADILQAHRQKGRVLRVARNEVSINFMEGGVKSFAGRFDKSEWWPRLLLRYGELPMAAMTTGTSHAVLRRSMQRLYSNSLLSTSSDFQKVLLAVIQDTCAELSQAAETQEPVNIFALSAGAGLDSCTGHFLGVQHRTTSVRNAKEYTDWMWMLDADEVSSFWTTEMPVVVKVLSYVGLVPWSQQIQSRRQAMSQYTLKSLQDSIDEVESPNYNATYPNSRLRSSRPLLYESLRDLPDLPGSSQKKSSRFLYYAAELLDQLAAGSANLAVALGYCCFELSRHSNIQKALREELLKLQGQYGLKIDTPIVPPTILSELDKLPLLEACLTETMRLYPPVTGQLPRFVPPGGFTCDGFFIPKGTSVSAAAYNLHREEAVFEDPERWDPYRWIGCPVEVQKKMRTWIWSYGSGTYQCAGVHMARHMMNMWIATIYLKFSTEIASDEGTEAQLTGLGFPVNRNLPIILTRIDE